MTLKELSQLYYLKREIERDNKRLNEIQSEIEKIKQDLKELEEKLSYPHSPNYDGMPRNQSQENGIEKNVAKLLELQADLDASKKMLENCEIIIRAKQVLCIAEKTKLETFIAKLPNSHLRDIFSFRFIDGLSWSEVADSIGKKATEDSVKKMCYRYINKINSSGK